MFMYARSNCVVATLLLLPGSASIAARALAADGFARFDGPLDTIRILGNTSFPGTDATYECRVRFIDPLAQGHLLSEQRDAYEDKTIRFSAGRFEKSTIRGYNCGDINLSTAAPPAAGDWIHLAWVRSGSVSYLYRDGVRISTWTAQSNCTSDFGDSWMSIGSFYYGAGYVPYGPIASFIGDLDWMRVSTTARYAADFEPPYECEIVSDAHTLLLLRFNEAPGTASLIDEGPNRFVCQVGTPVWPGGSATAPLVGLSDGAFPSCPPECRTDVEGDGVTDGIDLSIVLTRWGTDSADYPRADVDADGVVDGGDLAAVLFAWGPCQ